MSKGTSAVIKHTMDASACSFAPVETQKTSKDSAAHSSQKMDLTPTSWLSLIPLWVLRIHALNHHRALLQRVARVTGEFDHRSDAVGGVSAAEVPILHKGFVTHAPGKSFGQNMQKGFILGSLCCSC